MPKLALAIPDAPPSNQDSDGLTALQAAFVVHFTATPGAIGNMAEAARRAGYSEKSAKEIGSRLVNLPHVRAAIERANRERISGPISTMAIEVLESILLDPEASRKDRAMVAFGLLDRGGYVAPSAFERAAAFAARGLQDKPKHEMTKNEIARRIAALSAEITDREAPTLEGEALHVDESDDASKV